MYIGIFKHTRVCVYIYIYIHIFSYTRHHISIYQNTARTLIFAYSEVLTFAGVARQLGWASPAFCEGLQVQGSMFLCVPLVLRKSVN